MRIKCIGFSVIGYGSPSIPVTMNNYFKMMGRSDILVDGIALGGLSIEPLAHIIKTLIKKGDADLIILEITTSAYSKTRKSSFEEAKNYIQSIVSYITSLEIKIIFLNLFRLDIDDNDLVVQAINAISSNLFPIIDFKAHYRSKHLLGYFNGTKDGIHPTIDAIHNISKHVSKLIVQNIESNDNQAINLENTEQFNLIPINLDAERNFVFSNGAGVKINSRKVFAGENLEVEFLEKTTICGIFFLYGPDTNQSILTFNDQSVVVSMRDRFSYYRRMGYFPLGPTKVDFLKIEHPKNFIDVNLAFGSEVQAEQIQNYIIGFSSRS